LRKTYVIVMVTTANKQEAEKIMRQLLETKLIACANIIGPVSSHFHWSGKTEMAEEYLVLMKSRIDLFEEVKRTVRTLHSYEVPEILALPVIDGSKPYLDWMDSCLRSSVLPADKLYAQE
jgi:periplasmic divalent cation tolerance protein